MIRHSHPDKSIDFGTPPSALSDPRQPKAIYVEKGVVFLTIKNAHICTQSVAQSAMFEGRACGTPVSKKGVKKNEMPCEKIIFRFENSLELGSWASLSLIFENNRETDFFFHSVEPSIYCWIKKGQKFLEGINLLPPPPFFLVNHLSGFVCFFFSEQPPARCFFSVVGFFSTTSPQFKKNFFFQY